MIFTNAVEAQNNMDSIRGYTVYWWSEAWWKPDKCCTLVYVVQYDIIQIQTYLQLDDNEAEI